MPSFYFYDERFCHWYDCITFERLRHGAGGKLKSPTHSSRGLSTYPSDLCNFWYTVCLDMRTILFGLFSWGQDLCKRPSDPIVWNEFWKTMILGGILKIVFILSFYTWIIQRKMTKIGPMWKLPRNSNTNPTKMQESRLLNLSLNCPIYWPILSHTMESSPHWKTVGIVWWSMSLADPKLLFIKPHINFLLQPTSWSPCYDTSGPLTVDNGFFPF